MTVPRRPATVIVILALAILIVGSAGWILMKQPLSPASSTAPVAGTNAPPETAGAGTGAQSAPPTAAAEKKSAAALPASGRSAKAESQPLPPLIPGGPLDDERFAAMSAKIVIAAMGLKKDKDWEINTMAYMAKVFDGEKVTEADYRAYAEALTRHPDRGRAVAENIISKAEKKLGYRVSMEALPTFKVSPQTLNRLDKKINPKSK